jgi:hypothetical protein
MFSIGIDVSHWDPILAWKNYAWDYVFVKATEGEVKDAKFDEQWKAARGYTIRAPYSWFHWFVDPVKAVTKLKNIVGSDPGELPPVLDLEDDDGEPLKVAPVALKWLRECRKQFGRTPIVYSSWGFADHIKMKDWQEFTEYPLWMAQYPWDTIEGTWTIERRRNQIQKLLNNPNLYVYPNSFQPYIGKPDFVQWTGKCPPEYVPGYPLGLKEAVDINFYRGSLEELKERYGITGLPPKENGMGSKPITWTANLKSGERANLRVTPGLTGGLIRTAVGPLAFQGTGQKGQKDGYWWAEVVSPEPCWIAFTTSFENVQWIPPTPVPTRKIVKSVIYYDDNSTEELIPRPPQS